MNKIRFWIFALRWLWQNRMWKGTRQKYKALDREWNKLQRARREVEHETDPI